jgi:general secretion pathway protein H
VINLFSLSFFQRDFQRDSVQSRNKQQGFTLLELIIVMVLISLTAAFTIPKIQSSLYSNELSATAQHFVYLVTETAQEARARHTSFILHFDADTNTFLALPATARSKTEAEEPDNAYLRMTLDDSVQLVGIEVPQKETLTENNETGIFFTNKGYTRKAAVHFKNEDGDQVSIMLSPFLGVARILEGRVSLEDDQIMVSR